MLLAIVIPTRDRPDLALSAVRSALAHDASDTIVVVSDNSSRASDADSLRRWCMDLAAPRLSYMRPPQSMSMADHWNWVLEETIDPHPVTHVAYLCDRWRFYPDTIADLMRVVSDHPDEVISYSWDTIDDFDRPIRLLQRPWSGRLLALRSERLLDIAAAPEGWDDAWQTAVPRPLNSIVPVRTFDAIRERFGTVFGSLAPDYCFAFRCLAVVDSVLHYDRPCMIDYALFRSTGANYQRGGGSEDLVDFLGHTGHTGMNFEAPIPDVHTAWNVIFHEYCVARREAGSDRYKPLDRDRYMESLAQSLELVQDAAARSAGLDLLRSQGWKGSVSPSAEPKAPRVRRLVRAVARPSRGLRRALRRGRRSRFRSTDSALRYAHDFPRPPTPSLERLATLHPRVVHSIPVSGRGSDSVVG